MTIPVVIEKRTTCAPPTVFLMEADLARHIGEGSVSVVMEENIVTPERAEQVIPSIVVIVAYAYARLPPRPSEARLFRDVCEGTVTVVLEKMRGGLFPGSPVRVQPASIREIDVEPSVIIVVKECDAAAFRLNNDALMVDTSPDIGDVQPGLSRNIDELNRRFRGSRHSSFDSRSFVPRPQRSRQPVQQRTAKHEKR